MARQEVGTVCRQNKLKGLDLHTWTKEKGFAGAKMSNVNFSGFGDNVACANPSSISFDDMVSLNETPWRKLPSNLGWSSRIKRLTPRLFSQTLKQGLFEFYASFQGITLQDGVESIDFCIVQEEEFDMVYVVDIDGSLRPSSVSTRGPSTLLASDDRQLLKFVDTAKCVKKRTHDV